MITIWLGKTILFKKPSTVFPKHLRPLTGFTNAFDVNTSKSQSKILIYDLIYISTTNQNFKKSNNFNIKERENVEIEDKDKKDRI